MRFLCLEKLKQEKSPANFRGAIGPRDCLSVSLIVEKTFSLMIEKTDAQTHKEVNIITHQVAANPE